MDETQLTPRQRDVLIEVCKGRSNKLIARALGMAESTVKLHLTEIFRTIGVKTRAQAIIKASNFAVTSGPYEPLTDQEILEEFTEAAFSNNDRWSNRILQFGHAIETRIKGKSS